VAHNQTTIDASIERVFTVLSDADSYGYWVVGSDKIRGSDAGFPEKGTRFYHRVGVGPLKTDDHTEVLDVAPPYLIELKAKARPFGTARVRLVLTPRGPGTTDVTMIEEAGDALSRVVFNPLTDVLVRARNTKSLQRLKRLSEAPETVSDADVG
jgi:uncharacterized protein YndB with AHSA1/START domain